MNVTFETGVPRIKFLPGDRDEVRNTATRHSYKTLDNVRIRHNNERLDNLMS